MHKTKSHTLPLKPNLQQITLVYLWREEHIQVLNDYVALVALIGSGDR